MQYKAEVSTLEVGLAADPDNAELKADLAKVKGQGDLVATIGPVQGRRCDRPFSVALIVQCLDRSVYLN